jgi:hypothetical protein
LPGRYEEANENPSQDSWSEGQYEDRSFAITKLAFNQYITAYIHMAFRVPEVRNILYKKSLGAAVKNYREYNIQRLNCGSVIMNLFLKIY